MNTNITENVFCETLDNFLTEVNKRYIEPTEEPYATEALLHNGSYVLSLLGRAEGTEDTWLCSVSDTNQELEVFAIPGEAYYEMRVELCANLGKKRKARLRYETPDFFENLHANNYMLLRPAYKALTKKDKW